MKKVIFFLFLLGTIFTVASCNLNKNENQSLNIVPYCGDNICNKVEKENNSCAQDCETEILITCCKQCSTGASRDVRGMDIGNEPCDFYADKIVEENLIVDQNCYEFFQKTPMNVNECTNYSLLD